MAAQGSIPGHGVLCRIDRKGWGPYRTSIPTDHSSFYYLKLYFPRQFHEGKDEGWEAQNF